MYVHILFELKKFQIQKIFSEIFPVSKQLSFCSLSKVNTKEEIMESQNQHSQPQQQSEGTTFHRTCFNGLNDVSRLLPSQLSHK